MVRTINKIFGENVRTHRKRLRMTQEKLAEECGKSLATIQLLESGKTWPEKHTIDRLSETFDVPDTVLFDHEPAAPIPDAAPSSLRELLAALAALDDDQVRDALAAIDRIRAESAGRAGILPDDDGNKPNVRTHPPSKLK